MGRVSVKNVVLGCLILTFLHFLFYKYHRVKNSWAEEATSTEESNDNYTIVQTEMYDNQYCTGYNLLEGTEEFRDDGLEPITLTTHATSDMMRTLEKLLPMWDGPISVGVFVDYHSSKVLEYLQEVHRCDEEFRRKVTVHFAFRISPFQTTCPTVYIRKFNRTCSSFKSNQHEYRKNLVGPFQLYPSNLMRNMARHGAKSDIHFLMDADMILSEGFAQRIRKIANEMINGMDKKVLVVRRFESTNGTYIPRNSLELKQAMLSNSSFQFHHKFYPHGHRIVNLTEWFDYSARTTKISTQEVIYPTFHWEVQVILHRNDLYNAAYFPSRIKVMHSLIHALCRANYTFHVLSHVFNVHEGIKLDNTIYSKATIDHQLAYVMEPIGERFIDEMNMKYPETQEKCGKFKIY